MYNSCIQVRDVVLIKNNLKKELDNLKIDYSTDSIESIVNTKQTVDGIWTDDDNQVYIAIGNFVDIPIQSCQKIT